MSTIDLPSTRPPRPANRPPPLDLEKVILWVQPQGIVYRDRNGVRAPSGVAESSAPPPPKR